MDNLNDVEKVFQRQISGHCVKTLPQSQIPARVTLSGNHIVLEPQSASSHAKDLFECSHKDNKALKIWDYLLSGPWTSEESYLDHINTQCAKLDQIFYTLRKKETGEICGQASFMNIYPKNGAIEIGNIWFSPSLQKTLAATEAMYIMIKHAMDDLDYRRVEWKCNALNKGSRSAARRLGFRFEGVLFGNVISKGRNRDTAYYSILNDEWPVVKEVIEKWMSSSNLDHNNTAKYSLSVMMSERSS